MTIAVYWDVKHQNKQNKQTEDVCRQCRECTMFLQCYENIIADHLTAELLYSCSGLFWHMQSRFPHDVAQMHHVQIRD